MGREPEKRYCLLENESPLHPPVQVGHNLTHVDRREESPQGSTRLENMRVRDLVQGHEDRGKNGVHGNGDAEGHKDFRPGERFPHHGLGVLHTHGLQEDGYPAGKYRHGQFHSQAQQSPDESPGQYAESRTVVHARADAQADALAQGGKDSELHETHDHPVLGIERLVERVHGIGKEKREQAKDHASRE